MFCIQFVCDCLFVCLGVFLFCGYISGIFSFVNTCVFVCGREYFCDYVDVFCVFVWVFLYEYFVCGCVRERDKQRKKERNPFFRENVLASNPVLFLSEINR